MPSWDPEVLTRIRHLSLRARRVVRGVLHGEHRSRALGPGVEFVDYKEYAPGDPLRDLDWRVLARSDRVVIRRYQAESDLPSLLVLDASGDMATGLAGYAGAPSRRPRPPLDGSKMGYALSLAATLAWFLHLHGEPLGLHVLGGTDLPWRYLPPRPGRAQLGRVLATLASLRPDGRADLGPSLASLAPGLRRHALVVVVSDLMEEVGTWAPALHALGLRRTDLRLLHVQDPAELDLDYAETRLYFSPEGGDPLPVDPVAVRDAFRKEVAAWRVEVRDAAVRNQAVYLPARTDRPLDDPIVGLLQAGQRRGRAGQPVARPGAPS